MADTESIMRLGIEAARAGDKEEARNLFRLLTREQPDNTQAWLWLAGVAEDREEKRAALERVLALDPTSELARKGLQALGVTTVATAASGQSTTEEQPFSTRPLSTMDLEESAGWNTQESGGWGTQEESAPVSGADPAQRSPDEDFAASLDSIGGYESQSSSGNPGMGNYTIPDFGDDDNDIESYMNRPRVRPEDIEIEPEPEPEPRRRSNMIPILVIVGAVVLLALLVFTLLNNDADETANPGGGQPTSMAQNTAAATSDPAAGGSVSETPGDAVEPTADATQPEGGETAAPTAEGVVVEPTAEQPTEEQPPAEQPTTAPPPPGDTASANPQVVAPNSVLEANGWTYNFPDASYSTVIAGPVGNVAPAQGRWVVALVVLNSSQAQQLPADFFVVKDEQGRVYTANPDASEAYVNTFGRGFAADFSLKDQLPAGVNVSVPLLFDVPPGATNLVLFAQGNAGSGYLIQQNVP